MNNSLIKIMKLKRLRSLNGHRTVRTCSSNHHWSKLSYLYGASNDPLRAYTIGGIFNDAVQQTPNKEYLVSQHENKRYTFATMNSEVDNLCKSFNALGLTRGDRFGVCMPNCALYVSTLIATARLGLILVNINPAYQSDELKYSLTLAGVKCLVIMDTFKTNNYAEILEKVDPDIWKRAPNTPIKSKVLPMLETVIFNSESSINGAYNLESFLDLGSNKSYEIPIIQPDEGWNIGFTSGSTGKPKAALLNHFGLVNNTYSMMKRSGMCNNSHKDVSHNVFCCSMPLFHAFALSAGFIGSILTKSTIIFPSATFEPKATVDAITREKCTYIFGTPTVFIDTMSVYENLPPEQQVNDMKFGIIGGAPCSTILINKFESMFPGSKLMVAFGMTETGICTFQHFKNEEEERLLSTVGYIQDHVEAKVVDSDGNMVPFGTPGELLIRGYLVMNGYFNDEEKTKETIDSDGWLSTGDQCALYENGYGNYVGRLKDIIIRGGENIFPKEIELFLESHPLIIQAQVYGVPDDRMGEEVCASIIVNEDSTVTEADIKSFSRGKISHFKIPKYILIEKDGFPMTGSGKVQKFKLKELAMQRITSLNVI